MNRSPISRCNSVVSPLRALLATALLTLSIGQAVAVPDWADSWTEPTVFEWNYPVQDERIVSAGATGDLTDNQMSEALFLASPEIIEALILLAGLDAQQTP